MIGDIYQFSRHHETNDKYWDIIVIVVGDSKSHMAIRLVSPYEKIHSVFTNIIMNRFVLI